MLNTASSTITPPEIMPFSRRKYASALISTRHGGPKYTAALISCARSAASTVRGGFASAMAGDLRPKPRRRKLRTAGRQRRHDARIVAGRRRAGRRLLRGAEVHARAVALRRRHPASG